MPSKMKRTGAVNGRSPAFLEEQFLHEGTTPSNFVRGLDYWHLVDVHVYDDLDELFAKNDVRQMRLFSTKAPRSYAEADYEDGCFLFFGRETTGLPEDFLDAHYESCVRIPMRAEARSLNLSNSVAVGVFEALRQLDFPHLKDYGKMREG